jgi:quinol monooxygenase YgiN
MPIIALVVGPMMLQIMVREGVVHDADRRQRVPGQRDMKARWYLVLGAFMLTSVVDARVHADELRRPYVRVAQIEIDSAQLESYKAIAKEQIETAIRVEPGVLTLYAVAEQDDPTRVFVFEIYADLEAYRAHIETPHFKKYKADTQDMVKSLKLVDTVPIVLGAKAK